MDLTKKPFVLEMLNDMKEYHRMPAFWKDKEKNYSIEIGYCPACNKIKDLTRTRRFFEGNDCLGAHYRSESVPLQCFDYRHEGAIEFSPQKFDSLLKYVAFFSKNKRFLESFELKSTESEERMPEVKVTNKTYEIFVNLVNKWENDEIKCMHNPTYINTDEFHKLVRDYEKWNLMKKEQQVEDIKSLHVLSKTYRGIIRKHKKEISGVEKILAE